MAEVEVGGVKFTGGKMVGVIVGMSSMVGVLYGGFEMYKDYMDMKDQIQNYVAPDLSGIDKQQAIMEEEFTSVRIEVNALKENISDMKSDVHDIKIELKDDISTFFDNLDKQDERNRNNVEDVRGIINSFEIRMDNKIDKLDAKIDSLEEELDKKIKRALDNPLVNGG